MSMPPSCHNLVLTTSVNEPFYSTRSVRSMQSRAREEMFPLKLYSRNFSGVFVSQDERNESRGLDWRDYV